MSSSETAWRYDAAETRPQAVAKTNPDERLLSSETPRAETLDSQRHIATVRNGLSAVVLAFNEARNIRRCIESLSWCDEVVVVDDCSTDATREVAESLGARVVQHRFESFAKQRNWALQNADLQQPWVLMLDADEVATPGFANEAQIAVNEAASDLQAICICRKTVFMGKTLHHADGFPVWIMRLVRNGMAAFEDLGHGERPVPSGVGTPKLIREPLLHFAFSRGMDDWWNRHVRYAKREAIRESNEGRDRCWRDLFAADSWKRRRQLRALTACLPGRGWMRFLYQYIYKCGFLDGTAGLQFCRMMACYEAMISVRRAETHLLSDSEQHSDSFSEPVTRA